MQLAGRRKILTAILVSLATSSGAAAQDLSGSVVRPSDAVFRRQEPGTGVVRKAGAAQQQQQLQYSVVFADSQDVTHFRDEHLVWQNWVGSPRPASAPRVQGSSDGPMVTPFLDAEKIGFLRLPGAYRADWHPAPSKRFVMVLSGIVEVEVGDGERRRFGPGSVLLVTDTQGRGHRTNVVGDQDVLSVWVPVP